MFRYMLIIEYDGSGFAGWQRQANASSIQQTIEEACQRFCHHKVRVHGAGRTDAGVHAAGQVGHLDLNRQWPGTTVRDAINYYLADQPIAILAVNPVDPEFSARFSAKSRRYFYRIKERAAPPALDKHRVWHIKRRLCVTGMSLAAQHLIGHHDFTTFRDRQCQAKSPIKILDKLTVIRQQNEFGEELHITAEARSFLHTQVRSMVGSLVKVGNGSWSPEDIASALAARDRKRCAPLAPPNGLYLIRVDY